jgi:hypothetical protein
MPIQVRGVLVQAMSGTELSRVRTEFRLRLLEPINKSPFESRGPTLLCNQVLSGVSAGLVRALVMQNVWHCTTAACLWTPLRVQGEALGCLRYRAETSITHDKFQLYAGYFDHVA